MNTQKESMCNIMNVTTFDDPRGMDKMRENFIKLTKIYPKMCYGIKFIAGDPYYYKMSEEETVEKMFLYPESDEKLLRSQKDIDDYMSDNVSEMMPLDGPLHRTYFQ